MRLASLLVLSACGRLGFDASEEAIDSDVVSFDADTRTVLRIDVLLFEKLTTCVIGDACPAADCISLANDAGTPVVKFANNANFKAVVPGDPRIASAQVTKCMTTTLDAAELAGFHAQVAQLASDVQTWSGDTIRIDLQVHDLTINSAASFVAGTLWLSPAEIQAIATTAGLSRATDFVLATHDVRDDTNGLHFPFMTCGISVGANGGPVGAGYSWVPSTRSAVPFECAELAVYEHEFLARLEFAMHDVADTPDLYNRNYPACGMGDPDPTRWFPAAGDCMTDPDWTLCGSTGCDVGFIQHIFETHWAQQAMITNHCRDGVMDHGETGIDVGGVCL